MYGWIFRRLPGPKWLKTLWALLIIAAVIYALFTFVFPPINEHFNLVTIEN